MTARREFDKAIKGGKDKERLVHPAPETSKEGIESSKESTELFQVISKEEKKGKN